jgi:uncharacterized protein with von Willebrand factor type A (vWA) domain
MYDIIRFSGMLRENGIPASVRSTQTACQAYPLSKDNNLDLREALACIYLKDQRQRKKFNECYELFFHHNRSRSKQSSTKQKDKTKFIRKLNISVTKQNKAEFNYNNNYQMKLDHIKNTLNDADDNANQEGDSKYLKSDIHKLNILQPELIDLCQKLGRKIATKRVRRNKQAKKQKPDIRKTIRKNLKHGGSLLELVKSKPKIKKQNHFFLSDISVSCDWISIWFFCMIYAAQNSFNRARAFEFDNKTVDITSALHEINIMDAFIKVLDIRKRNSMIHGKSNMYTAFESFLNQANINHKSYVLILSDCRDWAGPKYEREPLSADFISNMSRKAKRVLILNPEPKIKWNAADSCVSRYEDAGAEAFEVSNLEQLADFIVNI